MKVAVIGAAGGIGQALALLLKNYLPKGSDLGLHDISPVTPGIAVDLSHIPTPVSVNGFAGEDPKPALLNADVVLVCAGVARKPGMDRADLFNVNANITKTIAESISRCCPDACVGIITNPVNTMIPLVAEVFKKAGTYNRNKLFGVTTLDVLRSETFIAQLKHLDPKLITVPVIGGHSGTTILPLLSQVADVDLSPEDIQFLTSRIQNAGTEVVEAKAGGGSATLSMGQAACRFGMSLVRALSGEQGIVECAFVEDDGDPPFFARPVRLGKEGIVERLSFGPLSEFEHSELNGKIIDILNKDIQVGIDFVNHQ